MSYYINKASPRADVYIFRVPPAETPFIWQVGYKEAESAKNIQPQIGRYYKLAVIPAKINQKRPK